MATPTSASEWKKKAAGEDLLLPSGNVCRIKRPGMEKLFTAGVLPDGLTQIAVESIEKAQSGGRPQDFKSKGGDDIDPELMKRFLSSENAFADIFDSMDRITAMCVIEPKAMFHKRKVLDGTGNSVLDSKQQQVWEEIPEEEREEELLYTDEVDALDKQFIFNFVVGGTRDIESFRQEHGDAMATLQSGEDVGVSSE